MITDGEGEEARSFCGSLISTIMWFWRRRHTKPVPLKKDVEALDVRPKGVTRPLRAQHAPDFPADIALNHANIERAVQQFLGAENWSDTYAVLVRDHDDLMSTMGIALVGEFVQRARQSGMPGAEQVASYLEMHQRLLERAHIIGIEPAWTEFQDQLRANGSTGVIRVDGLMIGADTQAIAEVLRRFLSTNNWDETHTVLVDEQTLLLSDAVDQFLSGLIHVAQESGDPLAVEGLYYLEVHRQLLREARRLGIASAWHNFEIGRQKVNDERQHHGERNPRSSREAHLTSVTNAIKSLLSTSTWDETRQVLEREQELLLTDTCESLLSELIAAAERDHEEHAARNLVYLKMHQRLLELARREGITVAWSSFEEAMGLPSARGRRSSALEEVSVEEPLSPIDAKLHGIRDAVHEFLSASSWTAAHAILATHQDELLTDLAVALISAQADQMQARGTERDLYATRLLNLQALLLRRAREIGLDAAWQEFELERN